MKSRTKTVIVILIVSVVFVACAVSVLMLLYSDTKTTIERLVDDLNASHDSADAGAALVQYQRSMSAKEMLQEARKVYASLRRDPSLIADKWLLVYRAIEFTMLCLEFYPEKARGEEGIAFLLEILQNREEDELLRSALASIMVAGSGSMIGNAFSSYHRSHATNVARMLIDIGRDVTDSQWVRKEAIHAIDGVLYEGYSGIFAEDPNVISLARSTHKVVSYRAVFDGTVTLDPETIMKLAPVEKEILHCAEVLDRIRKDAGTPDMIRKECDSAIKYFLTFLLKDRKVIEEMQSGDSH